MRPPVYQSWSHPATSDPASVERRACRAVGALLICLLLVTCVSDERLAPRPASTSGDVLALELLQNPDFEAGGAPWQDSDSLGRGLDSARVHGGVYAQRILAGAETGYTVYQEVLVDPGAGYDASGWVATDSLAGAGATIELLWLDTLGLTDTIPLTHLLGTGSLGWVTGSTDWTRLAGQVTAPPGAIVVRVQLRVAAEPGDSGSATFDDLSLAPAPPPPDPTPPAISITAPLQDDTVQHTIAILAEATDSSGVAGVHFLVDSIAIGVELTEPPYTIDYSTDTLPNGDHALGAVARDSAGNMAISDLVRIVVSNPPPADTTPPLVVITAPLPGAVLQHTVFLDVDATDDGSVAGVQLLVDGLPVGAEILLPPYRLAYATDTLLNGTHLVTAVARDTAGNSAMAAGVAVTVSNPPPRDVVLILTDDQRFDQMPYMPLTSTLLNAETVRFSRGFITTSLCCPSRSSILTGLYAHNHGVKYNSGPSGGAPAFNPSSTVATWLHGAGYRTGLFGKYLNDYNLISPAIPPGWDVFDGLISGLSFYNYSINATGTVVNYGSTAADYGTDVFAARAMQFIRSTPARQPLFLMYTPTSPHAPSTPHPSDVGRYAGYPNWRPASFNEADVSDKPSWVKALPKITTAQISASDALHRSMLEALQSIDRAVASIIGTLQQTGRWNNTLVVFLSDNGLAWGEHRLRDTKLCPYEECIRVPYWVRAPGLLARTDTNLVANIDLAPTISGWAGVVPPVKVNGVNLLPLLQNPATTWRSELLIEHFGTMASQSTSTRVSSGVRTARYYYGEHLNGSKELYDLKTDPLQLVNVASKAGNATLITSLRAKLNVLKLQ